jgi:hypothetical protein
MTLPLLLLVNLGKPDETRSPDVFKVRSLARTAIDAMLSERKSLITQLRALFAAAMIVAPVAKAHVLDFTPETYGVFALNASL